MEGSYKLNRIPRKSPDEAEAETNGETMKIDSKTEQKNKYIGKPKLPFPGFKKNLFKYCAEYSNSTSIQGIKYIGEQRPIFERLAWLVFFCISLYFCINLIIQTYVKWDTSPVLVSFARSPTPVWKIPFPAITVCSETKARQTVYNFTKNYHRELSDFTNMTDEEKKEFSDVALFCAGTQYRGGNLTIGYDTLEFLIKIAPKSEEMFWTCVNPSINETDCQGFFSTLTEEGICYTYNMLDRNEVFRDNVFLYGDFMSHGTKSEGWTLEKGYPKNAPIDTYPRRVLSAGFESRFVMVLKSNEQDFDYICRGPVQGYKIFLHNPAETPILGTHFFLAPVLQEINLAVKPDMMMTSDGLRNYSPHKRQCYFPEERYLTFFRSYSQQSCEVECLTNFTRAKCGCVAQHMPHEEETPVCGSGNKECMVNARKELLRREVQLSIGEEELDVTKYNECNCLPGCTSLVYNAETSQADIDVYKIFTSFGADPNEFRDVRITRVNIFFTEQQFITSERNELYGQTDFLANCGGLLGLFTGFSFLSLIEIFYFLSLRLMGNIKRYGRQYWSGSEELINNDMYDHTNKNVD